MQIVKDASTDGKLILPDDSLREKLISKTVLTRIRHPVSEDTARRFWQLECKCLPPSHQAGEGRIPYIVEEAQRGWMRNVLEYAGEPITLTDGQTLQRGDWLGYIELKKTGHIKPEDLYQTIQLKPSEEPIQWANLVKRFNFPKTYDAIRPPKEDPQDKPVAFLNFVTVRADLRKLHLVNRLLTLTLQDLRANGFEFAVAYARVAGMHGDPNTFGLSYERLGHNTYRRLLLEKYLGQVDERGFCKDYTVRFHQEAGGIFICGIPDGAGGDEFSKGNAAFVIYDIKGRFEKGK